MRPFWPSLILGTVLVAGCSADPGPAAQADPAPGVPKLGADLDVVAAVYPLAWVAREVAPYAEVELLNEGGQDAHDIDLSPVQRAAVETADVVLYTGELDYQPQVEEAVPSAEGEVVDASRAAGEAALIAAAESGNAHGHEDGEEHAAEDGEEHGEEHGEEGPAAAAPSASAAPSATESPAGEQEPAEGDDRIDPHLWFSPSIMARVAVATGKAFAEADPDNADAYQTSAAKVRDDLMALGEEVDDILGAECLFDEAVVSHAAYGYLLEPFQKRQHALTDVGAEADASAGELAEVVDEIREQGFRYVLAEPSEGRAAAEAVAREAEVELLEVLPLDAVPDDLADRGLPALVRAQARRFGIALGCT